MSERTRPNPPPAEKEAGARRATEAQVLENFMTFMGMENITIRVPAILRPAALALIWLVLLIAARIGFPAGLERRDNAWFSEVGLGASRRWRTWRL